MPLDLNQAESPSLARIVAAMFYDLWLVIALWLLGTIADTFIRSALGIASGEGNHLILQLYFAIAPIIFFTWFWSHGGQTLGMKSWKLMLVSCDGNKVNYKQAVTRVFVALLSWGVFLGGYLWRYFDKNARTWHDIASKTRLVIVQKKT